MKKAVILILSLIWAVMIYSQNYYPLVEENKTWNVLAVAFQPPAEDEYLMYDFSITVGDNIQVGYLDFNDCYLSFVNGQCFADAGPDIIVCNGFNGMDTVQIGGNPTASGGTAPYTYIWETSWTVGSWTYTASDFLNDTTLANPSIIYPGENLTFFLTVIDSESNICTDSVFVGFTNFGTHLGYVTYNIQQGDSIFLTGMENVFGGFPPYRYLWRPNHGLSDSTSLSFWAKPDTSVAYYLALTDSSGCTAVGTPVYFVNVAPSSIDQPKNAKIRVSAFPNPANDQITFLVEGDTSETLLFEIFDNQGRLIHSVTTKGKALNIKTEILNGGMNFYKISCEEKIIGQGKIIIK